MAQRYLLYCPWARIVSRHWVPPRASYRVPMMMMNSNHTLGQPEIAIVKQNENEQGSRAGKSVLASELALNDAPARNAELLLSRGKDPRVVSCAQGGAAGALLTVQLQYIQPQTPREAASTHKTAHISLLHALSFPSCPLPPWLRTWYLSFASAVDGLYDVLLSERRGRG